MLVRADSAVALSGAVEAAARLQKVARFEKATYPQSEVRGLTCAQVDVGCCLFLGHPPPIRPPLLLTWLAGSPFDSNCLVPRFPISLFPLVLHVPLFFPAGPFRHTIFFRAQSISSEHSRRCSYLSVATVIFLLFIFLLFLFWFVVSLFFVLRVPLFVTTLKHKLMLVACFGSA